MSGPGLIEAERKGWCQLCGAHDETRPYGPNGEEICFQCGMKNPAQTEKQMGRFLFGTPEPLDWHAWFAWRPVRTINGDLRWLCTILRRQVDNGHKGSQSHDWGWIYHG